VSELATGALPPGWISAAIVDLAEVNPRRLNPAYADDEPVVFVPMARVAEESRGMDVQERRPFAKVMRGYSQFQPADVLFAKITPCMENGKVAVVPGIEPPIGYGSTEFFVLRPRADGISVWIARCVSQARFRRLAQKNMQGAVGQLRVPKVWIENAEVPVAPPAEQRRILRRLDSLFAQLDDGIAALKRAEANLERHRASVLKAAVEGRLTERWRSENPPDEMGEELLGRILAERRKRWEEEQLAAFAAKGRKPPRNWQLKYREPVAPDTSGLSALPEGWCWATVDQVTAGDRSCAYGVLKPGRDVPSGVPLVRVGNIKNGTVSGVLKRIAPRIASKYNRTRLRGGELLITLVGAIGRTAVASCAMAGANTARAVGVVPVSSLLDAHWAAVWFRSPLERHRMIGQAHEVARKTLNLEDVRSAPIALPPLSEQAAILLGVNRAERQATSASDTVAKAKRSLQALRQSILKRAFEGRLVPQDPDDGPAAVLLERVRAAREA